jgi:hypothetical protein
MRIIYQTNIDKKLALFLDVSSDILKFAFGFKLILIIQRACLLAVVNYVLSINKY